MGSLFLPPCDGGVQGSGSGCRRQMGQRSDQFIFEGFHMVAMERHVNPQEAMKYFLCL